MPDESVSPDGDKPPESLTSVAGVIVAAGSGERLGADRPKAMIEVAGRPLWRWAVDAMREGGCERIIVVTPPEWVAVVAAADPDAMVVPGGDSRQESVGLGLAALAAEPPQYVLVHDAARGLTPAAVVGRVVASVRDGNVAVTPVVPVADTIRQFSDDTSHLLDRHKLCAVQTPQGFVFDVLTRAHAKATAKGLVATDDVTLAERAGQPVTLVDGDPLAFKITTRTDLALAQLLAGGD